jgi:hypothetical protein
MAGLMVLFACGKSGINTVREFLSSNKEGGNSRNDGK